MKIFSKSEIKHKAKIYTSSTERTKEAAYSLERDRPDIWKSPYIQILAECMTEYESVANESFLTDLITISFTHL